MKPPPPHDCSVSGKKPAVAHVPSQAMIRFVVVNDYDEDMLSEREECSCRAQLTWDMSGAEQVFHHFDTGNAPGLLI